MPTILTIDGFRLFFYSADIGEPMHVHIEHGESKAKFWVKPIVLASSYKMKAKDLKKASKIVENNIILIERKWDEYFSNKRK